MRSMLMVFLFLLLICGVFVAETDESESLTVIEGDFVTLQTHLSDLLNDDTILWLFGPKDTMISQIRRKDDFTTFFVTDDGRFRGRLGVDQKTGSLTIRNTRIRHSGHYKLRISRQTTTSKIFNLTVTAVVNETEEVKLVSVLEGDSVTLHTDDEMHKEDLVVWRFGDKGLLLAKIDVEINKTSLNDADWRFRDRLKLDHQTGSLTITNTRTEHEGLYELQVRGRESSQRFHLSVDDPGLDPGAIAGIAVGVVVTVLLLAAAAVAFVYYRYRLNEIGEEKKESVTEGESVTLHTGLTEIQGHYKIEWWYEAEENLIAEINEGARNKPSTMAGADGRFRSKLRLDGNSGDLTLSNIRTIHSGLYILKTSSRRNNIRTKHKRFILTVNVKSESVMLGDSVLLQTDAEIQRDDLMLWTFGPENCLVVKTDSGVTSVSERFRNRLELDEITGALTIRHIETADSGHFKLQIINSRQTTFRRFNVAVIGSIGEHGNGKPTVVTPLMNGDIPDGANEQQATSHV